MLRKDTPGEPKTSSGSVCDGVPCRPMRAAGMRTSVSVAGALGRLGIKRSSRRPARRLRLLLRIEEFAALPVFGMVTDWASRDRRRRLLNDETFLAVNRSPNWQRYRAFISITGGKRSCERTYHPVIRKNRARARGCLGDASSGWVKNGNGRSSLRRSWWMLFIVFVDAVRLVKPWALTL